MVKDFIECGKIVKTHGVKGEIKINPWCDNPEFILKFKTLYINKGNKALKVEKSRKSNNVVLVKFENINTLEEASILVNQVVYINKKEANIGSRHFIQELIGCEVFNQDGAFLGTLTDVFDTPANDVWQIENNGNTYYFAAVDSQITKVNPQANKIILNPIKGVFEDED